MLPIAVVLILLMLPIVAPTQVAIAQEYPTRPIRLVASEAGGGGDFVARILAQELAANFGQQVLVDNRGGNVVIPAEIVAKAAPDGYTLLSIGSLLWLAPFLQSRVPYDVEKDFAPITLSVSSPSMLVVHPSLAATSVKELIALAKAKPGEINFGSGAIGSTTHLSSELFKSMAGINIVRVSYKGVGPALNGLIGGETQMMIATVTSVMPHVKSGKLKGLGVASSQPSALAPSIPTIAATGLPGYESSSVHGLFAPAKTPPALVARLNQTVVSILSQPAMKEKLLNSGIEVVASSPAQLAASVKSEASRMGKVIKDAGIHAE